MTVSRRVTPVLCATAALMASACGGRVDGGTGVQETCFGEITVVPATASMHPADTLRANVANTGRCAMDGSAFRWFSNDPTVATVDSVGGLVTARRAGTATITARFVPDATREGAMVLKVVP